ncbi:aminopeptidase P family protein [Dongshaea marina]|uniref:aminopeptidase P family protein n=1 Tax=Dongshaea marina TaxID=2047966 RepID=UPI000D3E0C34|nr:aminopeptidase P family protein [Dongshaea marina]
MDNNSNTQQRLDGVRNAMAKLKLDALIIPHDDENLGEYTPLHCERLAWVTGFTGSAGAAIIMPERATLFVDGRYTIQAREQSPEPLFEHEDLVETPYAKWLTSQLKPGARVGFDPKLHNFSWYKKTKTLLEQYSMTLVPLENNLIDPLWSDRPAPSTAPARELPLTITGVSSQQKRDNIAKSLTEQQLDAALITQSESINWLLNIRGRDIECLPVVMGFAIVYQDSRCEFYTDPAKFSDPLQQHMGVGVTIHPQAEFSGALKQLGQQKARVQVDPDTANAWCQLLLESSGASLNPQADPCMQPKAAKNTAEVDGMKRAHLRDAAAVCRFLSWLDKLVEQGGDADEASLAAKIDGYRKELAEYVEPSFSTISALGPNAAMCHYNFRNGTPRKLECDGLYLVDSGGQYLDGTTDITRTVKVGQVSREMCRLFTLVLKGNIALDSARFPVGTSGIQLDVLARSALWQQGYNYAHGTGHGVGHFLNVHEGPQRISPKGSDTPLQPGMVVSNEPGYYREGGFGIRSENLLVVQSCDQPSELPMLCFEKLTYVPFDLRLIERSLLTEQEIDWINSYHAEVYRKISPALAGDDLLWLEQATRAL